MSAVSRRVFVSTLGALPLAAGDFWQEKKFSEWSDKEAAKILNDSPWSRQTSVTLETGMGRGGGGGGRGGRGGRGGGGGAGGMGGDMGGGAGGAGGGIGGGDGMGGGQGGPGGGGMGTGGGMGGGGLGDTGGGAGASLNLLIRWRSSRPVREAYLRLRLGSESAGSEEAKQIANELDSYLIEVAGIQPRFANMKPEGLEALKTATQLIRKGKDPIAAGGVRPLQGQGTFSLVFAFPKTDPIHLEDKEVEFACDLAKMIQIKKKFKLKDMVYHDALSL